MIYDFRFMKLLNIPFIPQSISEFFNGKIFGTIEFREKQNKSRPDMVQLLLDARKADPSKCKINFLQRIHNEI
jgi:hypothetical protein